MLTHRITAPDKSLLIHLQVLFPLFHSSHWQQVSDKVHQGKLVEASI